MTKSIFSRCCSLPCYGLTPKGWQPSSWPHCREDSFWEQTRYHRWGDSLVDTVWGVPGGPDHRHLWCECPERLTLGWAIGWGDLIIAPGMEAGDAGLLLDEIFWERHLLEMVVGVRHGGSLQNYPANSRSFLSSKTQKSPSTQGHPTPPSVL